LIVRLTLERYDGAKDCIVVSPEYSSAAEAESNGVVIAALKRRAPKDKLQNHKPKPKPKLKSTI
jgi:hypothetical protein